jgi:hypothetical protein
VTAGIVDFEALAGARLESEPFRWAHFAQALHPSAAAALRADFPRTGFWRLRQKDGEKDMDFRIRCLVPLGARRIVDPGSLHPSWHMLVEELLSSGYRNAFARALGHPLDDALLELAAWRWGPAAELGPHLDIPRKVATEVFYFNESWDPTTGGCLRILGSPHAGDVVAELPPTLGSASLVVRSDSSWHSVPAVSADAGQERLSVTATWQHPGSGSPFWTTERDGSVRCHARGSTRAEDTSPAARIH